MANESTAGLNDALDNLRQNDAKIRAAITEKAARDAFGHQIITHQVLSALAPVSADVMSRTHATPDQQAMFKNLADIFDKKTIGSNPLAQAGALDLKQGEMQTAPYSTSVHGVTYTDNWLPKMLDQSGPVEQRMISKAGYNIGDLKNKIVIGPEVSSGEHPATIPHELAHRGINRINEEAKKSVFAPKVYAVDQEGLIRIINIMHGQNVDENLDWLNTSSDFSRFDRKPWTAKTIIDTHGEGIQKMQDAAAEYLSKRGLKDAPAKTETK